jgi:hypothetical protein
MHGLPFKIGFGRPIGWKSEVGQIVGFAHFASKQQSQRIIFLSIIISPLDFGSSSKIGLGSKVSIQEIGHPSL